MDLRKIILRRLAQIGKSRYWLAERLGESPSRTAVYAYLRGEGDMMGRHVGRMLRVLGLQVTAQKRRNR